MMRGPDQMVLDRQVCQIMAVLARGGADHIEAAIVPQIVSHRLIAMPAFPHMRRRAPRDHHGIRLEANEGIEHVLDDGKLTVRVIGVELRGAMMIAFEEIPIQEDPESVFAFVLDLVNEELVFRGDPRLQGRGGVDPPIVQYKGFGTDRKSVV